MSNSPKQKNNPFHRRVFDIASSAASAGGPRIRADRDQFQLARKWSTLPDTEFMIGTLPTLHRDDPHLSIGER